jgi:signal transduction histidine kinase
MPENSEGTWERQNGTGKRKINSRFTPHFSIAVRIVSFAVIAAILAGSVVGLVLINVSQDALRAEVLKHNLTQANLAAEFASTYMETLQNHLKVFSERPDTRQAVINNQMDQMQQMLARFVEVQTGLDSSSLYDPNGILRTTSVANAASVGQYFGDREWFQQVMASMKPYLGIPLISRITGKVIVPYGVPILDKQGQIMGVLGAGISFAKLSEAITSIEYGESAKASIIDFRNDGLIIADNNPRLLLTPISANNEILNRLSNGELGVSEITAADGERYLIGFARVTNLPWGILISTPSKIVFEPVHRLIQDAIIYCVVIVIFAVIVGILLTRGITIPLGHLLEGTKEIGRGNLAYKMVTMGNDEIGELSLAFTKMTDELKKTTVSRDELATEVIERKRAEERINELYSELETRVIERTAQLKATNEELETFAYSVSHDLRSPLRGIDGWSLALLEDYKDKLDEKGHKYLGIIRSETQRMGNLIDDLLMFSRQARSSVEWKPVDLTAMAESFVSRLQRQNPSHHIDFIIQPGLKVQGDFNQLETALFNLFDNAVKFSSKNPHSVIEFGVTGKDGDGAFFVRDNGVGFDMEYAHKLFGVFQRLHKLSEFPGTGIGLAIVQRIIHKHGGRIWGESRIGKGATFYFTLKEGA